MSTEIIGVWNDMNSRLTNFVNGKVNDPELTKDIIQDVFLKTFSKIDTLKNKEKLVAWIYQITRNEIISHFRKLKLNQNRANNIESNKDVDATFTAEVSECIHPFIQSLPQKYREAVLLADVENISQIEIAKRLNISYSGAKSRIQRGREMI